MPTGRVWILRSLAVRHEYSTGETRVPRYLNMTLYDDAGVATQKPIQNYPVNFYWPFRASINMLLFSGETIKINFSGDGNLAASASCKAWIFIDVEEYNSYEALLPLGSIMLPPIQFQEGWNVAAYTTAASYVTFLTLSNLKGAKGFTLQVEEQNVNNTKVTVAGYVTAARLNLYDVIAEFTVNKNVAAQKFYYSADTSQGMPFEILVRGVDAIGGTHGDLKASLLVHY